MMELRDFRCQTLFETEWQSFCAKLEDSVSKYLKFWYDLRSAWVKAWTYGYVTLGYVASSCAESSNSSFSAWMKSSRGTLISLLYTRYNFLGFLDHLALFDTLSLVFDSRSKIPGEKFNESTIARSLEPRLITIQQMSSLPRTPRSLFSALLNNWPNPLCTLSMTFNEMMMETPTRCRSLASIIQKQGPKLCLGVLKHVRGAALATKTKLGDYLTGTCWLVSTVWG